MVKSKNKNNNTQTISDSKWKAGHIVLYIFLLIIIIIILKIVVIKKTYGPTFEWWNGHGGANYTKFFNLFAVMSSYDSILFYYVSKLFGNLYNQITRPQIIFLVNRIFPLMVSDLPNNANLSRFVLPSHIAKDIKLSKGDGDKFYNNFLKNKYYTNPLNKQIYSYDDTITLTYDYSDTTNTPPIPTRKIVDGKVGVYPGPSAAASNDWKSLFQEWGVKEWLPYKDSPGFLIPTMTPVTVVSDWLNTTARPDNFLARYGIMPDSPLIISYINNAYNDPRTGLKLDAACFTNLIGGNSPSLPGGWISYLNGMESSSISADEYTNYIYSKYLTTNPADTGGDTSVCDVAGNDISGAITGVGIASMAAFAVALGPATMFAFVAAGIGLGVAQAYFANEKCKK